MKEINYSFIIPHKNSPKELNRLVNSIPRREDVEIIVVDDGSDKNIVNWDSFKFDNEKCICKILSEKSGGGGYARNLGLKHAQGKWLLFPDADDYYVEGFIDVLDNYKTSECDVVYFGFHFEDSNGNPIEVPIQKYNNEVKKGEKSIDWVKYKIYPAWCKMVRRSFVDFYGISFEEVSFANDRFFTFQIGYFSKKVEVETEPLYHYLYSPQSKTNSNWDLNKAYVRINNWARLNPFYDKIGHPEWKNNIMSYLRDVRYTPGKKRKLALLLAWIINIRRIYKNRKGYVEIIEKIENDTRGRV